MNGFMANEAVHFISVLADHTDDAECVYANVYNNKKLIIITSTISEGDWRLSTHANPTSTRRFVRFWASGEQSSPKWEIPCPGRT